LAEQPDGDLESIRQTSKGFGCELCIIRFCFCRAIILLLADSTTDVISADSRAELYFAQMPIVIDSERSLAFCFLTDVNPHEITIKVSGGHFEMAADFPVLHWPSDLMQQNHFFTSS
jgi:hypothetical protein